MARGKVGQHTVSQVGIVMKPELWQAIKATAKEQECTASIFVVTACMHELEKLKGAKFVDLIETGRAGKVMLEVDGNNHESISVVFSNHKGGVAKTASAASFAHLLGVRKNLRILVIDADSQCNLTTKFGHEPNYGENDEADIVGYIDAFIESSKNNSKAPSIKDYILTTPYKNINIVKGSTFLSRKIQTVESNLSGVGSPIMEMLDNIKEQNLYDYVMIDTAPSMDTIVLEFLNYSDYVVSPTDVDQDGITGVNEVGAHIANRLHRKRPQPAAKFLGAFFTKVNQATSMGKSLEAFRKESFIDAVNTFDNFISQSVDVPVATTHGKPVTDVFSNKKVSKQYLKLLDEMLAAIEKDRENAQANE